MRGRQIGIAPVGYALPEGLISAADAATGLPKEIISKYNSAGSRQEPAARRSEAVEVLLFLIVLVISLVGLDSG